MSTEIPFVDPTERERARSEQSADFYAQALEASKQFRAEYKERKNSVKWNEMPMERSADGIIKHIINEQMNTKECCIDIYMQFIPGNGGTTGTSRHLSEEIAFVIEGTGYDLHYDVHFRCEDEFVWEWDTKPKKFEWGPGDFIYIPPYVAHKRVTTGVQEARVVVTNSRIMKAIGFDWFDQLEPAPGFEDLWVPPAD
jgi:mannose-6-phosphate isomerase-like protein (cupin superfamily)